MKTVSINNINFSNNLPLKIIAGPCVLESLEHAMMMAQSIQSICNELNLEFIFKSSFDKANRTSINGIRGVGLEESLEIFAKIKKELGVSIITDVHEPYQCDAVSKVVDVLQIPAFLCRQTDLLKAAAKTNKAINIKKGQFLAPWDMKNIVSKMESFNHYNFMLCERGVSFGYNTLVTDIRSLSIMAQTKYPVIFDATHSVQQPGGNGTSSSGNREFAPILARAAVTTGIAGVFLETHNDPDNAPSDGANMIKLDQLKVILQELKSFDELSKSMPRFL